MHLPRPLRIALVTLSIAACDRATSSREDVVTRLEVPATTFAAGDAVPLRVIVTNRGRESVQAGVACGPGFDVEVRAPDGSRSFILRGTPSVCPIFDSNIIEPEETDSIVVPWRVPGAAGYYSLTGGVQVRAGLRARSVPHTVTVR